MLLLRSLTLNSLVVVSLSIENRRASIDVFLKAAGYLECAVKNVLPQFSAEQRFIDGKFLMSIYSNCW